MNLRTTCVLVVMLLSVVAAWLIDPAALSASRHDRGDLRALAQEGVARVAQVMDEL